MSIKNIIGIVYIVPPADLIYAGIVPIDIVAYGSERITSADDIVLRDGCLILDRLCGLLCLHSFRLCGLLRFISHGWRLRQCLCCLRCLPGRLYRILRRRRFLFGWFLFRRFLFR